MPRDELRCPHRPPCPGCPRFGLPLATAARAPAGGKLAALASFAAEHGSALALGPCSAAQGYRQRARLAVRGRAGSPKIGIFQEGSHRIADIPRCHVQHPRINEGAAALKHALRETGIEPYTDSAHRGLLRYAQFVVERASQSLQVVLVGNCETRAPLDPLLERLGALLGTRLHSLFWSANTARTNAILGPRCEKVSGPDALQEEIAGACVYFPPDAFGQANLDGYERIVAQIGAWVPDGADVVELYAGVGAIGLSLLPRAARVRFNELAAGSLRGLSIGIDALPPPLRARAQILPGGAGEHAPLARGAELVIADPPRKGLDPALRDALCAEPPRRFVYLSCDPATFLADARALLERGALRLRELIAYDLFPFTDHVEVLALFASA